MSIQELKNRRKNVENLQKAYESLSGKKNYDKDPRYWTITQDEQGNGSAKIRFLPAPPGEDLPFAKILSYSFKNQNTNKWYIEKSPRSISDDQKDPVYELNYKLWGTKNKEDEKQARSQKLMTHFHSNILVIEDAGNPENNGKVFLFSYGKKIMEKIQALMNPDFEDEEPVDAFDPWGGATFRLKVKKTRGDDGKPTNNYDTSKFDNPTELFDGDDEKIEEIWKKCHSLKELLDPKHFKSYDQLKSRLDVVLGNGSEQSTQTYSKPAEDLMDEDLDDKDLGMPSESVKNFDLDDEDDDISRFNDV